MKSRQTKPANRLKNIQLRLAGVLTAALMTLGGVSPVLAAPLAVDITVRLAESPLQRCVVLLHGLARTSGSMEVLAQALNEAGWHTANVDYPSRDYEVAELSAAAVGQGMAACQGTGADRIDAVTHSLGGILMRDFFSDNTIEAFGRLVMLGPPNHGSEVVDNLRDIPGFEALNGPAGLQLGTEATSVPNSLGPVTVDTAVIAGTTSINLLLSNYLPNPDDGKVSVASARLEGMCAFLTLPVSHPFIMSDEAVIEQVIRYLSTGKFTQVEDNVPEYPDCGHRFIGE